VKLARQQLYKCNRLKKMDHRNLNNIFKIATNLFIPILMGNIFICLPVC